jgi:two-component system response regulator YesN
VYSILIVDDESIICRGIQSMINRINNPLISSIYIETDVLKALKTVNVIKPEIIITDIRMEKMNGLDFINNAKASCPDSQYIILSGYDEFEYAKRALKFGAIDYLLKPARMSELAESLQKAVENLEKEKRIRKKYEKDRLEIYIAKLENNINSLISGKFIGEAEKELKEDISYVFPYQYFTVTVCRFLTNELNVIFQKYSESVKQKFADMEHIKHTHYRNQKDEMVIIFNLLSENEYNRCICGIKSVNCELKAVGAEEMIISVSGIGRGINTLHSLYSHASGNLKFRAFYEPFDIIELKKEDENRKEDDEFIYRQVEKLREVLANNQVGEARELINRVFKKEKVININFSCYKKLYECFAEMFCYSLEKGYNAIEKFYEFNTIAEVRKYLNKLADAYEEYINNIANDRGVINIAKKYISQNFCKSIDMAVVANSVSMNYTYFSKIFKEQTGVTFSEYITALRLEEAKRLLNDPLNKIYEISKSIGYKDPKHFTKTFKKYFGISPETYRKT